MTEQDLIYKPEKTCEDIEKLLEDNRKLVYYMLTRTGQLLNQDAESAAWESLWDSLNLFDIFSTNQFSTFACTNMRNAINDVLRKQNKTEKHLCPLSKFTEDTLVVYIDEYNEVVEADTEAVAFITKQFEAYVATKTGIIRDVLLAWYNSKFSSNVGNLAIMCKTSPSYVSRVQCSFRAYLSGKMKNR